ncbi:MAG: ATPase, partial [Proteobacteria bacterium]|nr:ATPase [Pseudomonadota bacterium]
MSKKMSCCHQPEPTPCCHGEEKKKRDYLLIVSGSIIVFCYVLSSLSINLIENIRWLNAFTDSVYNLITVMFWGIAVGIIFIGIIGRMPREFVIAILGKRTGIKGILRATIAGVLLDLCSHGILMVGSKLYERGVSLSQVMAFLIASPWNSFSFTLILWAMVGFKWMITFFFLSMILAIVSGLAFESL